MIQHVVSSWHGCLANSPLCHLHMTFCLRSPSGGMTRHPLRSFQNGPVGICIASIGNVSSHCSMSDACSACTSVIQCSKELGELVSKTLMNACSGIIVISWLSSLPSSMPGGLNRVLAAVCVFLGTCLRMKWQSCNSACHLAVYLLSFLGDFQ